MNPILSVTEVYVEHELDKDSRARFQTLIFPNHVAGRVRRFDVVRLDLRRGRMEVIGRELPLADARRVATLNRCDTAEDYLDDHCDGFERGHDGHECAERCCGADRVDDPCFSCGEQLTPGGHCENDKCENQARIDEPHEPARVLRGGRWQDAVMAKHEEACRSADIECDECGDILDTEGNCPDCTERDKREHSKWKAGLDLYGRPEGVILRPGLAPKFKKYSW